MPREHRYTAADEPYLLERDATAPIAARARMEQRDIKRRPSRYHDEEDATFYHYGRSHRERDLRRVDRGFTNRDQDFYPNLEHQYNDLDPLDPGRRGLRYPSPPPYDVPDEELDFGLHGRHRSPPPYVPADEELESHRRGRHYERSPPPYDAVDVDSTFDDERYGMFRNHRLADGRLPFHARNPGTDDSNDRTLRDMSLGRRNRHVICSLRRSPETGVNHSVGFSPRVRPVMDPCLDDYYNDLDMGPRGNHQSFGRAGSCAVDRHRRRYLSEDDLGDDGLENNFRETRPPLQSLLTGHRSNLAFRSINDDIEDDFTGEIRAAAGMSHRRFRPQMLDELSAKKLRRQRLLARMQTEIDGEDVDAQDPEQERREARVVEGYTDEDSLIVETGHRPRDRRGRKLHSIGSRSAAKLPNSDTEELPRGSHGRSFRSRPRKAGNRQTPRQNPCANGNVDRSRGRNQRAPPSYDSVTAAQIAPRLQAEPIKNANRPPVAAGTIDNADPHHIEAAVADNPHPHHVAAIVPDNVSAHAVAPAVAENTANGVVDSAPPLQQPAQGPVSQANPKETARDGAESTNNSQYSGAGLHETSLTRAHTSRAEWGSDSSSDSGADTPDDDSDISDVGDESGERGEVRQCSVHIEM